MAKDISERVYTIPIRREWVKQRRIHRAPRAVNFVREFLIRHTKADDVKISQLVNEALWDHGVKKPPGKIKVKVEVKDNVAFARLPEEKVAETKKDKKAKKKSEETKPAIEPKTEDKKTEPVAEKKEVTKEETKAVEKKEVVEKKETKKEEPKTPETKTKTEEKK